MKFEEWELFIKEEYDGKHEHLIFSAELCVKFGEWKEKQYKHKLKEVINKLHYCHSSQPYEVGRGDAFIQLWGELGL